MTDIIISPLSGGSSEVEVVERKGLGHPDTICDALADNLSRNLCQIYQERCGEILHHNVDKALLIGGSAVPAFGGGAVLKPMDIILAGRAIGKVGDTPLPIEEIAIEGSRAWLRNNFHALDPDRHVNIFARLGSGSQNLQSLFARSGVPLANDTSIGVGFAPRSPLEDLVLDVERSINRRDRAKIHPAWGEDVKIMAVRRGSEINLTVACAMVDRYLLNVDNYLAEKAALAAFIQDITAARGLSLHIAINAADAPGLGELYLTVTGTSAEAGDDGQVGRGNRVSGLIAPGRPMSLEAAAGKNPRSHVGKIYNVLAGQIAEQLVSALPQVQAAQCLLVSQIGAPITEPALVEVKVSVADSPLSDPIKRSIRDIVAAQLADAPKLSGPLARGQLAVF
jgi:S-adenosylmethionine synthetase